MKIDAYFYMSKALIELVSAWLAGRCKITSEGCSVGHVRLARQSSCTAPTSDMKIQLVIKERQSAAAQASRSHSYCDAYKGLKCKVYSLSRCTFRVPTRRRQPLRRRDRQSLLGSMHLRCNNRSWQLARSWDNLYILLKQIGQPPLTGLYHRHQPRNKVQNANRWATLTVYHNPSGCTLKLFASRMQEHFQRRVRQRFPPLPPRCPKPFHQVRIVFLDDRKLSWLQMNWWTWPWKQNWALRSD